MSFLASTAQFGLAAELIGSRLAGKLGAGPVARIIYVPQQALPAGGVVARIAGLVLASEDQPDTINSKELHKILGPSGQVCRIVPADRAKVVTFQTWLGGQDPQLLVNPATGALQSIDYGGCFSNIADASDPVLNVAALPNIDDTMGRTLADILPVVERIEALSELEILESVAQMPTDDVWQSTIDRRLAIGRWLCNRQRRLRKVMMAWSL